MQLNGTRLGLAMSAPEGIVLKKSFWGDDENFSGPLMRFARGDMRDHIVSHKNDHGASYGRYAVLQWWSRLKISFCEIFGVVQFSTFATPRATCRLAAGGESQAGTSTSSRRCVRRQRRRMMKRMLVVLVNGITPVNTNLVFDKFADCLAAKEQMRRHCIDAFDAWDRGAAMNIQQRRQYVRERDLQSKRLLSNVGIACPTVMVI